MRFDFVNRLAGRRPTRSTLRRIAGAVTLAAVTILIWTFASVERPPAPQAPAARNLMERWLPANADVGSQAGLAAPAPAEGGSGLERVDVCGAGWVEAEPDGAIDLETILASAPMQAARTRVLDGLRQGDDFSKATALALELAARGEGSGSLMTVEMTCAAAACDATPADFARAAVLFDQLAKVASATSDARAYSLALQLCQWRRDPGSCGLLSTAQWAHLDPGNGKPWLDLLGRAEVRRDRAAVDDALYQLGAAPRIEGRLLAAAASVARVGGMSPEELLVKESLVGSAAALDGPEGLNGYAELTRSCSSRAVDDANRRELCERAATALVERSDSILSMRVGAAVGRRLGWPDSRFDRVDATTEASYAMYPFEAPKLDPQRLGAALRGPLDCSSIRRILLHVEDVGAVGERVSAERWLASSGRYEEFRQRGAAQRARLAAREAAEAASRSAR